MWEGLAEPVPRLLAASKARAGAKGAACATRVVGPAASGGVTPIPAPTEGERVLVMGWIGAHPDARDPLLAALWVLEETARASARPVIVLRLAPLVGRRSPLLALLAGRPRLDARLHRSLLQPIHEDDVVEGLARLLAGEVPWRGWYEVCGRDAVTVGELAQAASAGGFGALEAAPGWEPPAGVLREQGLSEPEPWSDACGVSPRSLLAPRASGPS